MIDNAMIINIFFLIIVIATSTVFTFVMRLHYSTTKEIALEYGKTLKEKEIFIVTKESEKEITVTDSPIYCVKTLMQESRENGKPCTLEEAEKAYARIKQMKDKQK